MKDSDGRYHAMMIEQINKIGVNNVLEQFVYPALRLFKVGEIYRYIDTQIYIYIDVYIYISLSCMIHIYMYIIITLVDDDCEARIS